MPDYSKGLIYKWVCDDCDEVYVGSTTNFTRRKNEHKTVCNGENIKGHHLKIYQIMREYGGFENWRMIQVETYPCKSKRELQAREEDVRKESNAKLNQIRAFATEQERKEGDKERKKLYYETNKEYIALKCKQYRDESKESIAVRGKEYYKNNAEMIKAKAKEYREEHKEEIKETRKMYYQKNKEQINQQVNVKVNCECGGHYILKVKARHLKSKKHQNYINSQN